MFAVSSDMHAIRREDIVTEYLNNITSTTLQRTITQVIRNHQQTHGHSKDIPENKKQSLIKDFNERWRKSHRTRNAFLNKNKKWLTTEIPLQNTNNEESDVDEPFVADDEAPKNCDLGKPISPFPECSDISKRRKTKHIREQNSTEELAYAT